MNISMIILSILLFVALYYLYKYLLGSTNGTNITKIKDMAPTPAYDVEDNKNPGSYRYSYAVWVHVHNLANTANNTSYAMDNAQNNILCLLDNQGTQPYYTFSLDLYGDTSLYVRYNNGAVVAPSTLSSPYLVTPNFPLQKWVLLIVSFDNKIMDLYLDGKLIKSVTLEKLPAAQTTKATMNFGQGDIDIYQYRRFNYPMDPQTAWGLYQYGTPPAETSDSYALNLNIKQNNTPLPYGFGKIQLF